jgi:tRNA (cmo5U34)-methyltransferase
MQDELVRAAAGVQVSRMLDLGAGTGETSRRCLLAHPSAGVLAIDQSQDMLDVAATTPDARITLRRARLEDPLPPGPFELVVSALAVHHLDGAGKALLFRRIRELLAPGGLFVMADVVIPDAPVAHPTPLVAPVDKPDRLADLCAWLREAGFEPAVRWAEEDLVVVAASAPGANSRVATPS